MENKTEQMENIYIKLNLWPRISSLNFLYFRDKKVYVCKESGETFFKFFKCIVCKEDKKMQL